MNADTKIESILGYFMGKNTPARQEFIINNLKIEKEELDEEEVEEIDEEKAEQLEEELAELEA